MLMVVFTFFMRVFLLGLLGRRGRFMAVVRSLAMAVAFLAGAAPGYQKPH
jgi:hypothetical protein